MELNNIIINPAPLNNFLPASGNGSIQTQTEEFTDIRPEPDSVGNMTGPNPNGINEALINISQIMTLREQTNNTAVNNIASPDRNPQIDSVTVYNENTNSEPDAVLTESSDREMMEITSQSLSQTGIMNQQDQTLNPNPEAIARYQTDWVPTSSNKPAKSMPLLTPVLPVEHIQVTGQMVIKREWELAKKTEKRKSSLKSSKLNEKSIQLLMNEFNDNQVGLEKQIYVALTSADEKHFVNIYDCSFMDQCKIVEDIPVDTEQIPTLMANLQQQSGILVDMRT